MISDLCQELRKNPNMQAATDAVNSIAMRAVVKEIYATQAIGRITAGIANDLTFIYRDNLLTDEEIAEAAKDCVERNLDEFYIYIPDSVLDIVSEVLIKETEVERYYGYVTMQDITNIFDAYSK